MLLDTHIYLWWLANDGRLSPAHRAAVEAARVVYVSAASIWEAAIKAALRRTAWSGTDLVSQIDANGFAELDVAARHGAQAGALPRHHDDPFDRMLIAQAQVERLTLVTTDATFSRYDVDLLG